MSGYYHNLWMCIFGVRTHVDSTAVPCSVFRNRTVFSVAFGDAVFYWWLKGVGTTKLKNNALTAVQLYTHDLRLTVSLQSKPLSWWY